MGLNSVAECAAIADRALPERASHLDGTCTIPFVILVISSATKVVAVRSVSVRTDRTVTEKWFNVRHVESKYICQQAF